MNFLHNPSSLMLLELLRPGPADFVFAALSVPTPGDPSQTIQKAEEHAATKGYDIETKNISALLPRAYHLRL
ncbi:hypothetical protein ACOSP7_033019 [Xanthoceras sorbifolium]